MKIRNLMLSGLLVLQTLASVQPVAAANDVGTTNSSEIIEANYYSVLKSWKQEGIEYIKNYLQVITPAMMSGTSSSVAQDVSHGYGSEVIDWKQGTMLQAKIDVEESGLYELYIDYYPLGEGNIPIQGEVRINGTNQYFEQRNIMFAYDWKDATAFLSDANGNQKLPDQVIQEKWMVATLEDAAHLYGEPMRIYLEAGTNTIELINQRGEAYIGNLTLKSGEEAIPYTTYAKEYGNEVQGIGEITIEAEQYAYKNQSFLLPQTMNTPSVYPYETGTRLLNAIGGVNWSTSGQSITWDFEVGNAGLYEITMKVLQNYKSNTQVFRDILIDGKLLFEELKAYPFDYDTKWQNVTLGKDGEAFKFYLSEGTHTITMIVDTSVMLDAIQTLSQIKTEIEAMTLNVKKLTGNQYDSNRQWDIVEYMPNVVSDIEQWITELRAVEALLMQYSIDDKKYPDVVSVKEAIDALQVFADKPNEIPKKIAEISEGTGSITQTLVNISASIQSQPLAIDQMYIHNESEVLPQPEASFFTKAIASVQSFFLSFTQTETQLNSNDPDVLDIWVNRPRQYVDVLQELIDTQYTPTTGIKVKLSIMPDESKLILANAANTQPDVALGISTNLPYELAVRGAAAELSDFPDFYDFIDVFAPGSLLSFIVDEKVYGLPETLDFYVMFYRKDILSELNIPIPNTWEDVITILPELQRYGMNFFTPLAGAGGFKPFMSTAPYIYQSGGDLYAENGMTTAINSEEAINGMKFMTDLFTVYALPMQVGNFYNSFRYGTLPIGISSFSTYIQLLSAAPEIAGLWDIALHPGIANDEGVVERWATGSAQSMMIFEKSKKKDEAWDFLKWWMDSETQTKYANKLQTLYGPTYMWNTANIDAFTRLPWDEDNKEVILNQWEWLVEVPKAPGSYMLERELSNVWNQIVFEGANPRAAIDDSVIRINREFSRKLEEFGYIDNGEIVKIYNVPTLDLVESWVNK